MWKKINKTKVTLMGAYAFVLLVLLPHTASVFAFTTDPRLAMALAIAFEITIAAVTQLFALRIKESALVEKFWDAVKFQLSTVPSLLLLILTFMSIVANWTHAYAWIILNTSVDAVRTLSSVPMPPFLNDPWVKFIYSVIFGAMLPVCSFAYAYVISDILRKEELEIEVVMKQEEEDRLSATDEGFLVLVNYLSENKGARITPIDLAQLAGISVEEAVLVLDKAGALNSLIEG